MSDPSPRPQKRLVNGEAEDEEAEGKVARARERIKKEVERVCWVIGKRVGTERRWTVCEGVQRATARVAGAPREVEERARAETSEAKVEDLSLR